jgi:hypothetical protein
MKADISDAPEHVIRRRHTSRGVVTLVCLAIGGIAALGAFQFTRHAAGLDTVSEQVINTVSTDQQLTLTSDMPPWQPFDASRLRASSETHPPGGAARQAVFNDQNFMPRGADNVMPLRVGSDPAPSLDAPRKMKLTIVRQSPSMKDRGCWPYRQGSIESRNCRASVGLKHRD